MENNQLFLEDLTDDQLQATSGGGGVFAEWCYDAGHAVGSAVTAVRQYAAEHFDPVWVAC
jgi:hypothetical protein